MKFFKKYQKLHIWLLADLAVIGLFLLLRGNRALMNALTCYITEPLKRGLAKVTYLVEFSVAEMLIVIAVGAGILLLCAAARRLVQSQHKWQSIYRMVLGAVCAALSLYAAFSLLWGVNYYTDTFQDKTGIYGREASVEELTQLTEFFAQKAAETALGVVRDEEGTYAESEKAIFAASTGIYENIYQEFPFLRQEDRVPKALAFSDVCSRLDFTGFFSPFTGEANLNVHCPTMFLPTTIVHELAHQRGIASEQECNFIAIATATASDHPVYEYAGWLMAYVHTGNALYRVAPEKWKEIRETLPYEVRLDLYNNSLYWQSMEGPLAEISSNAYDALLKNYGDEDGVQSYGTVVDMLITYYLDK
ncbi:MAG: DUF3810 domain-containing protein [Ruminococcaceae bacterium]|nr:DUF3810 domain-containing protein [Oscillospiraceae bacterium]